MRIQSPGRMLVLSMFMGCTTSSSQSPEISGTLWASSSPVRAGERPLPSSVDAMVPPVAMRRMRFMLVFLSYLPPQRRSRSAVLWHRASNVQTYYIICNVW